MRVPPWLSTCLLVALVALVALSLTDAESPDKQRDGGQDVRRVVGYPGDFDDIPPTSTLSMYDCDNSHRPMDGEDNQFQVLQNDRWWAQACPENLEWNQRSCRCEYPDGDPANTYCRDYRYSSRGGPGKYEQHVNGEWIIRDCSLAVAGLVWDQTACQCVWGPGTSGKVTGQGITPCDIMLNMTFDQGVKDEAKGSFVEVGHGNLLSMQAFGTNKNMAANFQGTPLNIWFFSNNELGSSLRVEFQFKMTDVPESRDRYQILLSNGCNVSVAGYSTPSLAIGYRPSDQSYLLAFQTVSNRRAIACTLNLGAYDWHSVSLIYEDGVLFLRVDGQPCIVSQDFSGDIQTTSCPLTIGADPLEGQYLYRGYMDNIVVARYCRRYMDVQENYDDVTGSSDDATGRRDQTDRSSFQHKGLQRRAKLQSFNQRPVVSSDKVSKKSNHKPAISPFRARIDAKDRRRLVMRNAAKWVRGARQDKISRNIQSLEKDLKNDGFNIGKTNHLDIGKVGHGDKRNELYDALNKYSFDNDEDDDEEEDDEDDEDGDDDVDDDAENDDRWLQESRVGEHRGNNIADKDIVDNHDDGDDKEDRKEEYDGDDALGWSGQKEMVGSSDNDNWQGDYGEKYSHNDGVSSDGFADAGRDGNDGGSGKSGMDSVGADNADWSGRGGCGGKDGHRKVGRSENNKENNEHDFALEERITEENYGDSDGVDAGNGEGDVDYEVDNDKEIIRNSYSQGGRIVVKYNEDDSDADAVNGEYINAKDEDNKEKVYKEYNGGYVDEEQMKDASDKNDDEDGDDDVDEDVDEDDYEVNKGNNKDESVINRVIKRRVVAFRGRYKPRGQSNDNMGRGTTERIKKVLWWMRTDKT